MNRSQLSALIKKAKNDCQINTLEICAKLQCAPVFVYHINNGNYNYNLKQCLDYLRIMNMGLQIVTYNNKKTAFNDYDSVIKFLIQIRQSHSLSYSQVSINIGKNERYLYKIENKIRIMSIDVFLTLIEYYNFRIQIEANGKLYTDTED